MAKKSKVTKAPKHRVNVEKKKTLRSFSRSKITVTMTAGEAEAVPATGYNFNPDKVPLRPGKPRIILPEQRIAELKAITGNPIYSKQEINIKALIKLYETGKIKPFMHGNKTWLCNGKVVDASYVTDLNNRLPEGSIIWPEIRFD